MQTIDPSTQTLLLQELTSLSATSTRVRRSAADRIHLAMPNLQKLKLGHGIHPPPQG